MAHMIVMLKEKIRKMVADGLKEEALSVLVQVRALAPEDQELRRMEEELR